MPWDASRADDWRSFVIAHGQHARASHLAHILSRSEAEITSLRDTGACQRLAAGKRFEELFALWHGRPPEDADWPVPKKSQKRGLYEWQAPEINLIASLVGIVSADEIAKILTERLRRVTGDLKAVRVRGSVQNMITRIGMQASDVIGGITTKQAGEEIGSVTRVHAALAAGKLRAVRVGRMHVIPRQALEDWQSTMTEAPGGYVRLSTIREALGIKSDKLSEYARLGYIPTALRTSSVRGGPNTVFGTWYIAPHIARTLVADRRAGKRMPWHGKPLAENLKVTFQLWEKRRHPAACETCAAIWGKAGVPKTFEEYQSRYPALDHGAKRHLTRSWSPGMTVDEIAARSGMSIYTVKRAIAAGTLGAHQVGRTWFASKSNVARWIGASCPTGNGSTSWVSLETASKFYGFSKATLKTLIAEKKLASRVGTVGASAGVLYVSRTQCGLLREKMGFTEQEAARRADVPVAVFRELLKGVNWRGTGAIPLSTIQAVIKRRASYRGHSIAEAAKALKRSEAWVTARIEEGTVRVSRAPWVKDRLYLSEPMMERLRTYRGRRRRATPTPPGNWLVSGKASVLAGVSLATLNKWATAGVVARMWYQTSWFYDPQKLKVQARHYWKTSRFKRARRPDWL